ncbi:hypothetical protein [Comamonas sp.]|uniref:hypothetical protein n=1 Tax=Comamonas sp. TaxID=34028 RepID=UPI0025845517|nr:hypothetical protein [Comamonas sp.]
MNHSFRIAAREALARAKTEIDSQHSERLAYAALELRMSIEAITYDRAQAYIEELPPEEYNTWKPKRLLEVLIEIDPRAAMSARFSLCKETKDGTPDPEAGWLDLGEERVFGLKEIRESYNRLGSYLHYPTIKQLKSGGHNFEKLRASCVEIAAKLEHVLAAKLFNANFKCLVNFECEECSFKVRKRFQPHDLKLEATCFTEGCKAIYKLERDTKDQDFIVRRKVHWIECTTQDCTHSVRVPHENVQEGNGWVCPQCSTEFVFMLGVARYKDEDVSTKP